MRETSVAPEVTIENRYKLLFLGMGAMASPPQSWKMDI